MPGEESILSGTNEDLNHCKDKKRRNHRLCVKDRGSQENDNRITEKMFGRYVFI